MASQYPSIMSPLDSLVYDTTSRNNQPTIEELQANLALWTNTQFNLDPLKKSEFVPIQPAITPYANSVSSLSTMSSPSSITYESLANYLDFELPREHLLVEPSITSEDLTKALLNSHANDAKRHKIKENPKEKDFIEEEKRKRNTAASARFRIKKKQREQLMEKTVQDMTEKSEKLEKHVHELESEIKFLKSLLLEKESCKPLFEEKQEESSNSA